MIITLIGPPGCGKGTQSEMLMKYLKNCKYLCAGDILRNLSKKDINSSIALKKGNLLSDDIVNKIIINQINLYKDKTVILDGFPRSIKQAEYLSEHYSKKIIVLVFKISEENIIKRVEGRFSCEDCKKIYNKYFNKTKVENLCDICNSKKFVFRDDDNIIALSNRVKQYKSITKQVLEYYKDTLIYINAEKKQDLVFQEIKKIFQSFTYTKSFINNS